MWAVKLYWHVNPAAVIPEIFFHNQWRKEIIRGLVMQVFLATAVKIMHLFCCSDVDLQMAYLAAQPFTSESCIC